MTVPANTNGAEVIIAGPKYNFTGQQQIWRLVWAHLLTSIVELPGPTGLNFTATYIIATINPVKSGAPNIPIILPSESGSIALGTGNQDGQALATSYEKIDIRADDMPNEGGITFFNSPTNAFSIELNFHCWFDNFFNQPLDVNFSGDVMAEINDLSGL